MSTNVITIRPDESVVSAAKVMSGHKMSCIIVVDDTRVVGILTETDILKRIADRDNDFYKRSVAEIMSSPVKHVSPALSILGAAEISEERHIKRLPVVENERLVGIVTQTDLVRTMTSHGVWRDVAEIMSRDVAAVRKTATITEAAGVMTSRNVSCVVALEGGKAVGILTERDLLGKVVAWHGDPTRATMEEVMSSPVATVPSHSSVFSTSRIMEAEGIRRLVVTEGNRLCGIVAQTDIFRAAKRRLQEAEDESLKLLEQSENNIYTSDLDGKTTYVNPAFLRLFEVSDPAEFIGQPLLPERFWLAPHHRTRVLGELRTGNVEIEELSLKTSKGKRIHVTLFSTSTRNVRGEINGSQGILHDVTEKNTGKTILRKKLLFVVAPQYCHPFNSYASPSPVVEEGRVYLSFGSPYNGCLDSKTGEVIWERTDFVCNHFRGPGSSPFIYKDLFILHLDGADRQYVVALDKNTGKTVWQTNRSVDFQDLDSTTGGPSRLGDLRKAYSTPMIADFSGKPILISLGSMALYGYKPDSGKELWRVEAIGSHSGTCRPVIGHGLVFSAMGMRGELFAVRPDGHGLVTDTHVVWQYKGAVPKRPSLLLVDDLLFMVDNDGVGACVEAKTGKEVWKARVGGNYSSSLIHADGKIYCSNETGKSTVIEAARQYKVLAVNKLDEGSMASPAVSGNALYLRTKTHLYRIEDKSRPGP